MIRVYNAFGGEGVCIESKKGRVKIPWEEIDRVMEQVNALKVAHFLVERTEEINRHIIKKEMG